MIERSHLFSGVRVLAILLAAGLAVAACNGEPDDDVADVTSTSEATTTTSTTEPTTTTSTTEPTTTTLDDEAAVRELHTYFMTEYFARDEREVTLEEQIAELETLAIDPQLQRSKEVLASHYDEGQYAVNPGYVSNIVRIDIEGDRASVLDCSQGRGELFSAEGDLLIPADDFFKLRRTELVKIDGRWWITELITGGDERCNPDDL